MMWCLTHTVKDEHSSVISMTDNFQCYIICIKDCAYFCYCAYVLRISGYACTAHITQNTKLEPLSHQTDTCTWVHACTVYTSLTSSRNLSWLEMFFPASTEPYTTDCSCSRWRIPAQQKNNATSDHELTNKLKVQIEVIIFKLQPRSAFNLSLPYHCFIVSTCTWCELMIFGEQSWHSVRALAFHQCGPGSISGLGVISELSLLVLYSAPRGFTPGTPVFPSPQKPKFDLIWFVLG